MVMGFSEEDNFQERHLLMYSVPGLSSILSTLNIPGPRGWPSLSLPTLLYYFIEYITKYFSKEDLALDC